MPLETAKKLIRNAGIAGVIWCAIILIGFIQNPGLNVNLFSLVLVAGLTLGIFKNSRFAAIVMLLFFIMTLGMALIAYVFKFGLSNNWLMSIGAILFLGGFVYYFVKGIIGTFAYHMLPQEDEGKDEGLSKE